MHVATVERDEVDEIARCVNVLTRWCAVRDIGELSQESLRDDAGVSDCVVDLFVLFGGGVTGTVDTLVAAMQAGIARRYAIVGGRGHATYWLDQAMERELALGAYLPSHVVPGVSSEAEMLDALLFQRSSAHADMLETRSTNCGNNITYLLDLLEGEGAVPESVLLCQDAVMQRRMEATWRRQVQERTVFAETRIIDWAAYHAELASDEGQLVWACAPKGIWPIDVYLRMLLGEVARLTDDERGYGPCGRDYVVHVDVPSEVRAAASRLEELTGGAGRPPDERYA